MFGKCFFVMSLLFSMNACAQPRYETVIGSYDSQAKFEKAGDCEIRFSKSGNCLSWKWEIIPTEESPGALSFKVYRPNAFDNTPVMVELPSDPFVVLWMPAMGHGSSKTKVSKKDVGTYLAENVFFVMPGEWEIKFQIKSEGNVVDEAIVSLTF